MILLPVSISHIVLNLRTKMFKSFSLPRNIPEFIYRVVRGSLYAFTFILWVINAFTLEFIRGLFQCESKIVEYYFENTAFIFFIHRTNGHS